MAKVEQFHIALAGNPNTGKTSVFNAITGLKQRVGNFSGVTVEKKTGKRTYKGVQLEMIDLPGAYSLSGGTLDERVAADYLIKHTPDLVVNVLDAGNLAQGLYLSTHLVDMGLPLVLVLNMWDEVEKDDSIDVKQFERLMGVPVVTTSAHQERGITNLLDVIVKELDRRSEIPHPDALRYSKLVEQQLDILSKLVAQRCMFSINPHWAATELLSGNTDVIPKLTSSPEVEKLLERQTSDSRDLIIKERGIDAGTVMESERYSCIDRVVQIISKQSSNNRMKKSVQIDKFLTNRYLGYPIFLVVMWLLFKATFTLGEYPMGWIEKGVMQLQYLVELIVPAGILSDLLIEGVIGGVGSVFIFLPNIIILFLGISLLETTGYMARAAFISDRLMHSLGLHGRSFIPLLTGFGCSVPAIMATRTLQTMRERVLTAILVPFMSCSAKLPVYVLFVGAFWGESGGNIIFAVYVIGILMALVVAKLFKTVMMRGKMEPCIMELPPYRVPALKSVSYHTWERTKMYLIKMGGVILIGSVILWFAAHYPQPPEVASLDVTTEQLVSISDTATVANASVGMSDLEYSLIGRTGKLLEPIFKPLGFNWQMGVSLFTGFVAKEVVVSTLGVLYGVENNHSSKNNALLTTLKTENSGITPLGAFSFLIFVLLYTPCFATIVATKRELGTKWMWFVIIFQSVLAYGVALGIFQIGSLFGF